ncbi:coiled-coil domain-containing protein 125 isoform X1 [Anguilla rostrata]|uniref:coiled-coil domain-containing protein 125 isoform X1 n=1 Tax=Anguilla rostrata TaxID=7938 RepID=UPI0030CE3960
MPVDYQISSEVVGLIFREQLAMHVGEEQAPQATSGVPEDDMKEGDLGDGLGRKPGGLYDRRRGRGVAPVVLPYAGQPHAGSPKKAGGNGSVAFSWKSCRALYTTFHRELEAERPRTSWRLGSTESLSDLSCEELRQRLQEVSEEVELLHCELEATQRHLEGKHEALKILQGRAMFDQATTHTKTLLQKSEERNKALEKEVNALQWEITFNQVQFKNLERSWKEKYERMCNENKALSDSAEDRLREVQELKSENASLSQRCLELVSMLSVQEKKAFQESLPPSFNLARDGTAPELAVLGACHCSAGVRAQSPCPCARTAAASRKQVLQLKQELEVQMRRKEEALTMADAFRIAFEQQLKRKNDHIMRLAEAEGHLWKDTSPTRREEAAVKGGSVSVAQKLKGMLQNCAEVKMSDDPAEVLRNLLDLLNDKEEALAHQRKVSYMLARHSEDLERRLLQLRGRDCETSCQGTVKEGGDSGGSDSPAPKPSVTQENPSTDLDSPALKPTETQGSPSTDLDGPAPKPFETQENPSTDLDGPALKPSKTQGGAEEDSNTGVQRLAKGKPSQETPPTAMSRRESRGSGGALKDREGQTAEEEEQRSEPG